MTQAQILQQLMVGVPQSMYTSVPYFILCSNTNITEFSRLCLCNIQTTAIANHWFHNVALPLMTSQLGAPPPLTLQVC